jgi:tetratricopeptide (TPR) repeat protein
MAARITLGVIARDAERTLGRMLESAAPYVDEIIIGFAGESSDRTEKIADEFLTAWASEEHPERQAVQVWIDWRDDFAYARNKVLERVTHVDSFGDAPQRTDASDYFLWLDSDDELIGGENLRRAIEQNPEANCLWAPYHYDEDEYGNLATTLWRERLVRNPVDWHWSGAVHEFLQLDEGVPLVLAQMNDVVVRHQPGRNKAKGSRNLDILYRELARQEPEPQQRTLLYLWRENASRGNLQEALTYANRYIARARFDDEAYQMAYGIADALRAMKRYDESRTAALKAIEVDPTWPDAYFLLARLAYEQGRLQEVVEWTRAGATKNPPRTSVIIDPRTYSYWPYYFLGLAYRGMNYWAEAAENLKIAAAVVPDAMIMGLIDEAERSLEIQRVLDHFMLTWEHLARHDEWLKARALFDQIPKLIENQPAVIDARLRTYASTQHVEDPQIMVDFYRNNPGWAPMDDAMVRSPEWAAHPRMAFARKSVTCPPPATILDVGSWTATSWTVTTSTRAALTWRTRGRRIGAYRGPSTVSARSRTWRASTMWRLPSRSSNIWLIRVPSSTRSTRRRARSSSRRRSWLGRAVELLTGRRSSRRATCAPSTSSTSRTYSLIEDGFLTYTESPTGAARGSSPPTDRASSTPATSPSSHPAPSKNGPPGSWRQRAWAGRKRPSSG